jgi:hypothetical protein
MVGVGVDDLRHPEQSRIRQPVVGDQSVEGAEVTAVGEAYPGHVEGKSPLIPGHLTDPVLRHEKEFGVRVDESRDQPGASHPVDMDVATGHPTHRTPPELPRG